MLHKCPWRIFFALLLLAGIFCAPGLILTGGELPELTPYARPWELPARVVPVFALSWVWLWTEGSVFQISLALLAWFCCGWALLLLLRSRHPKTY